MLTINSYEEFAAYEGKELGVSEWVLVSQEKINQFADATDDHQWIHVDVERCRTESPFGQTIAHGPEPDSTDVETDIGGAQSGSHDELWH